MGACLVSEWPAFSALPDGLVAITPFSLNGAMGLSLGGTPIADLAWPNANAAVYLPFRVQTLFIAQKLFALAGAGIAGNIDVGIYTQDAVRMISTGSVALVVGPTLQSFDIADLVMGPGLYYLAAAVDGGAHVYHTPYGSPYTRIMGITEQAAAFPLPATATFAASFMRIIPLIGAMGRLLV
jgi:hypothetical protein